MKKKVAVLAVDPVNGAGLFQYLESFYEKGISYKVFAVSDNKNIRTNSGITLLTDDLIANLKKFLFEKYLLLNYDNYKQKQIHLRQHLTKPKFEPFLHLKN